MADLTGDGGGGGWNPDPLGSFWSKLTGGYPGVGNGSGAAPSSPATSNQQAQNWWQGGQPQTPAAPTTPYSYDQGQSNQDILSEISAAIGSGFSALGTTAQAHDPAAAGQRIERDVLILGGIVLAVVILAK